MSHLWTVFIVLMICLNAYRWREGSTFCAFGTGLLVQCLVDHILKQIYQ